MTSSTCSTMLNILDTSVCVCVCKRQGGRGREEEAKKERREERGRQEVMIDNQDIHYNTYMILIHVM